MPNRTPSLHARTNPLAFPRASASKPRAVIVGGGVAGLTAAFEIHRQLGNRVVITVVSVTDRFLLGPAVPSLPFGGGLGSISFPLTPILEQRGIHFLHAAVERIVPTQRLIQTADESIPYDYLLIATGSGAESIAITGITDQPGVTHPTWTANRAAQAHRVLERFLAHPGPILIGSSQDTAQLFAAYELVLKLNHALRLRGTRAQATITFTTPEPYLGHRQTALPAARHRLERLFRRRDITVLTEAVVEAVDKGSVRLRQLHGGYINLPAAYVILLPPLSGVPAIWCSPSLADQRGLVPVDSHLRHSHFLEIYAAGDAAQVRTDGDPFADELPRTGYLAATMGRAAARSIVAAIERKPPPAYSLPRLLDLRVLDGGDTGMVLISVRWRRPHTVVLPLPGEVAHGTKRLLARYLVWKMRGGHTYLP